MPLAVRVCCHRPREVDQILTNSSILWSEKLIQCQTHTHLLFTWEAWYQFLWRKRMQKKMGKSSLYFIRSLKAICKSNKPPSYTLHLHSRNNSAFGPHFFFSWMSQLSGCGLSLHFRGDGVACSKLPLCWEPQKEEKERAERERPKPHNLPSSCFWYIIHHPLDSMKTVWNKSTLLFLSLLSVGINYPGNQLPETRQYHESALCSTHEQGLLIYLVRDDWLLREGWMNYYPPSFIDDTAIRSPPC